jgi:hypothetical protein
LGCCGCQGRLGRFQLFFFHSILSPFLFPNFYFHLHTRASMLYKCIQYLCTSIGGSSRFTIVHIWARALEEHTHIKLNYKKLVTILLTSINPKRSKLMLLITCICSILLPWVLLVQLCRWFPSMYTHHTWVLLEKFLSSNFWLLENLGCYTHAKLDH